MKKGFTFIEMFIVIAIISILASVFLVGLRGFRAGAYDARRLADLQKVQSYLEIYYTKNRAYPNVSATTASGWISLQNELVSADVGVTAIPNDPLSGSGLYYYYGVDGDLQSYVLGAKLTQGHSAYNEPTTEKTSTYNVPCDGSTIFCIRF